MKENLKRLGFTVLIDVLFYFYIVLRIILSNKSEEYFGLQSVWGKLMIAVGLIIWSAAHLFLRLRASDILSWTVIVSAVLTVIAYGWRHGAVFAVICVVSALAPMIIFRRSEDENLIGLGCFSLFFVGTLFVLLSQWEFETISRMISVAIILPIGAVRAAVTAAAGTVAERYGKLKKKFK